MPPIFKPINEATKTHSLNFKIFNGSIGNKNFLKLCPFIKSPKELLLKLFTC